MTVTAGTASQTSALARKAPADVVSAIQQASQKTGASFSYLMAQAAQESSFQPKAQAATSSARGLYQFIDRTWLEMVRDNGAKHGLGDLANQIEGAPGEQPRVRDANVKQKILDLRDNAFVSSLMAGEYAKNNQSVLSSGVGGKVGSTELYLAHFLGATGATRFLSTLKADPSASAADVLPEAAAANRNVFYAKDSGRALSVSEVYQRFNRSISGNEAEFGSTLYAMAQPLAPVKDAVKSISGMTGSRVGSPGWSGPTGGLLTTETVMALSRLNQTIAEVNAAQKTPESVMRERERKDRALMGV